MKLRIALIFVFLASPNAFAGLLCGKLNYKCQHKRNYLNKLRRNGLSIEQRGEEPRAHQLEAFPPTMNWFASRTLMERAPRRVLVMPMTNPWDNQGITTRTTRFFNRELQKAGVTEILSLQDMSPENDGVRWPWSKWPDPMRVGKVSYPELVEAAQRFQADAVLYSQVTIYKPTEPPSFGIKALLVEARDPECCEVLWALDAVFDSADIEIWDRAKQYYTQRTYKHWSRDDVTRLEPRGGTRFYGHRLMLVSIDRYLEYCFYEVTKNLRIASRGLRWPHYRHEREASPQTNPGDLINIDEVYFASRNGNDARPDRKEVRESSSRRWWQRRSKDKAAKQSRGSTQSKGRGRYPPYLIREAYKAELEIPETSKAQEPQPTEPQTVKSDNCLTCP